ncbi:MAG: ABC transporter permease [Bacteroidales bacterium]|jgi:putative ABC transport system permease protein
MSNFIKKFRSVTKLIGESIDFAFSQLKVDKFRTFLSLLGVCIGIFSIVAVFSVVDALKTSIKKGFDTFGSDVVFIEDFPMVPEEDDNGVYKWWEYRKRPSVILEEYQYLKTNGTTFNKMTFVSNFRKLLKFKRNSFGDGVIAGGTSDWEIAIPGEIEEGRTFSPIEMQNGSHVVIIGNKVKETLFPEGENPIGKIIKIGNNEAIVIGVFKKEGQNMVSIFNVDAVAVIPIKFSKSIIEIKNTGTMIMANPGKDASKDDFTNEMRILMRGIRRLTPAQKDNFSINQMSFIISQVDNVFKTINLVGWIIGGFSLLIGGFGIANIMFVSVKERTNQIGIQKALGAKKYVIHTQFLIESATLAIAGGFMGILLVYVISLAIPDLGGIMIILTAKNIIKGLLISSVIGIIAGVAPARSAANLDPVEAINS